MKKSIVLSIAVLGVLSANADYTGAGYYRVKNLRTSRWVSVIDDYGYIDYGNTTADLQAIKLWKNFDDVCCDPASVLRIYPVGEKVQLETQGTGIQQIIGHYAELTENGSSKGEKLYLASGTYQGFTKYLGDNQFWPVNKGSMATNAQGDSNRWFVQPFTDDGDNFFGVQPTIELGGKYYTSMYGSFPFSTYSPGIKVYYVAGVNRDMVYMEELKGTVPASTPVVFECSTPDPTTNRLHIGGNATALKGNLLKGNYFFNLSDGPKNKHYRVTKYDPNTMRVLGKLSNGSLGFIKDENLEFIPANSCYITVASGSPSEFRIVEANEYFAGVKGVEMDDELNRDVYNMQGILLYRNATEEQINALPHGLYIIGGKKIAIGN